MNRLLARIGLPFRFKKVMALTVLLMAPLYSVRGEEVPRVETADALMAIAHAGRAEWENFPGFQAQLKVSTDGAVTTGHVTVGRDGKIQLDLKENENFDWVQRALNSIVGHRLHEDDAITNLEFADKFADHPHGRLLKSKAENDSSQWRVKGDVLTEVHRASRDSRFIISIGDVWRNAEQKHLPRNFCVTTWEVPSGKLKSARQVHYEWVRVGTLDLPSEFLAVTNKSDGTTQTQLIEFRDHQLTERTAFSK